MQIFGETVLLLIASAISLSGSQNFQSCSYFSTPLLLKATTTQRQIELPNAYAGMYRPNQICKWVISTENENHVIRLIVTSYELEGRDVRGNCVADYVDIFDVIDGTSVFQSRLCGRSEDEVSYLSSGTTMNVQFISNQQYQYRGFRAIYESYKKGSKETKPSTMGIVFAVVHATAMLIIILCMVQAVYRMRKRKESQRNQGSVSLQEETHVGNSFPSGTAPPPACPTDLSPFVAMENSPAVESQRHIASSLANDNRPHTPPPTYEEINQATPVESNDIPPPSYDVAVRESSHIESPTVASTFV